MPTAIFGFGTPILNSLACTLQVPSAEVGGAVSCPPAPASYRVGSRPPLALNRIFPVHYSKQT